ncbi:MAG: 5-(carboxyamino)imidazole ribonucleotide mutase [Oligoflexia bacterium]|nr:5-(carboxyamino)imidazole ribonucleotide mutase [Oligoflexia bacterium]
MPSPVVAIAMGSSSDLPTMQAAADLLDQLGIAVELRILSAHRTPVQAESFAEGAAGRGIKVLICGAGMAAHLAGVMAARTLLPVIGVPLASSLMGLDALLSTVQMPPGVPVATVAIGRAGAKNAAWLAARILALSDPGLAQRLAAARDELTDRVRAADAELVDG